MPPARRSVPRSNPSRGSLSERRVKDYPQILQLLRQQHRGLRLFTGEDPFQHLDERHPDQLGQKRRELHPDGFLSLRSLPASILIVGGNVIGVEFATLLAELGVRVTLIEMLERILPCEEAEAAALLAQELKNLGVVLHTGVRMQTIRETDSNVELIAAPAAAVSVSGAAPSQASSLSDPHGEGDKNPDRANPAGILELSAEYALVCTGEGPGSMRKNSTRWESVMTGGASPWTPGTGRTWPGSLPSATSPAA